MKTLINSKITKKIIMSYVFDDNFKASDYNLTDEDINYLYSVVTSLEMSEEKYRDIHKSHKKFYSEKDKITYVNMVYDRIA